MLPVVRYRTCDTPARCRSRIVVDVFGRWKLRTNFFESLDTPVRDAHDILERRHVREQQSLELVFLDVRNHCFRAGNFLSDFPSKQFLQFLDRPASFVAESVEVHERSDSVEALTQSDHLLGKRCDPNVAAVTRAPGAAQRNRCRFDLLHPQMIGKNGLDEILLGPAFRRYRKADHGRPPRRFFCHSSPIVYSSSHCRYSTSSRRRASVRPSCNRRTMISPRPNVSTNNGD